MERLMRFLCFFSYQLLLLNMLIIGLLAAIGDQDQSNLYVVYMGDQNLNQNSGPLEDDDSAIDPQHIQILASVKQSLRPVSTAIVENEAKESIYYSYTKSFNAFAAKLSKDEVNKLAQMDQVLSVYPNRYYKLHTTKSWDFVGLPLTARRKLDVESNIIVGLLDTGITPESESFKDTGFGPPPTKWKGTCKEYANFSGCNNKLIGARYFKLDGENDPEDILSPVDVEGHGTHTSSTLAGNPIANASLYGLAAGTARGAVPNARVAAYKVCWSSSGCSDMDLLAGFNAAIYDGVDVISISIGGLTPNYSSDSIAIGSFHALKKGIITVASAGNDGPTLASLTNHAPWLVTVAASGINRQFRSKVELGDGKTISGIGLDAFDPKRKLYPLVNGADAGKNDSESKENARYCIDGSLDHTKVKGKLVYCELEIWGVDSVVKRSGGVGTIVESAQYLDAAQIFMAPATMVSPIDGNTITSYIQSTRNPSAVVYRSQELKRPAPFIGSFSSRGPNPGSDLILKPDIAAPGVDILASYTPLKSLTGLKGDTQFSKFSIMSGTSMACPHVAGVAAYVKSFHPSWTPSAIKSAILTSATPLSRRSEKFGEFAYGAGQVNPHKAISPGLVYDMDEMSYIQFLCREGYSGSSLAIIVGSKSINCSSLIPATGHDALNYPTMQLKLNDGQQPTTAIFTRTVTNVGATESIYNATIKAPPGVEISVKPMSLSFSRNIQKLSFTVVVKANPISGTKVVSGSLVWKAPRHAVRSPIVIYHAEGLSSSPKDVKI